MQLVLDLEDLSSLPEAVREGLFLYMAQKTSGQRPKPLLEGFLGDGTGQGNQSLLYAGAAARDGERCAQCGDEENLEIDHIVPIALGGALTVENVQLLCKKHNAIKGHRKGDMITIGAISVEAAIALIEGLSDRSSNLLKAMIALGANSGIKRDNLMDNPDFELNFKDGRSLNGVLTGIRKRFRHLFTEGERNSVDLFEYDDYQDTYSLGEGTYSSIREAFKYFDDQDVYQKNREIKQSTISLYRMGIGTKLEDISFGEFHNRETILVLPTTARSNTQAFQEHFNFDGNWVLYGTNTESEGDD